MWLLPTILFVFVVAVILYTLQSIFFKEKDWEEKYGTSFMTALCLWLLCGLFGFYGFLLWIGGLSIGGLIGHISENGINFFRGKKK